MEYKLTRVRFNYPSVPAGGFPTQRLSRKSLNKADGNPFVKMSANWRALGICRTRSSPSATFSQKK